jgi:lactoylglutathione lyase
MKFRHICILVNNLDKSLKFYRDIIGLKVSKILNLRGAYPEALLNIKGIKLTYVKMRSPGQPKNSPPVFELHYWKKPRVLSRPGYNHISFTVKDIDNEYKRLSKLGVKFISRPIKTPGGNTRVCFAYDPDKNLIELVEELKK